MTQKPEKKPPTKQEIADAVAREVLTPERMAQGVVRVRVTERNGYDIKAMQTPLDFYYSRRYLGNEEEGPVRYNAGNKFFKDFYCAGITPGMTIDFNRIYSVDKREYLPATDKQREALDSWRAALRDIHGLIGKLLAINVLCHGYSMSDIQLRYYRRGTDAMPRLLEVLDDLVSHYDLTARSRNGIL